MKKFILIFSLLFICQLTNAQSKEDVSFKDLGTTSALIESKALFGFQLGPTIPMGDFGDIDYNNEKSGLAKTGIQLKASVLYSFTETFYGILEAGYSSNPLDEDELIIPVVNAMPSFVRVSASSKNWNATTFNVGVGTRTLIDDRTYFLTKFGFRVQKMSTPSYTISLTDGRTKETASQSSASSSNLNLLLGGSIMTEISSTAFFTIGVDYLRSTHEFEDIKVNTTLNGSSSSPTQSFNFEQDVEMISIMVGFTFKI